MQSIFAFLDITKVDDFRWKNSDVSRTQVVCHVIYIYFVRSSVCHVIYIYFVRSSVFRQDITVPNFIIARYV